MLTLTGSKIAELSAQERLSLIAALWDNLSDEETPEDAAVPVLVVATNLSGAPVCLSRGAAVDAVLASAAIPIVFPSVRIGDEHLMDGAIAAIRLF
jgi:predicted acylesterase/phospholipase RssA